MFLKRIKAFIHRFLHPDPRGHEMGAGIYIRGDERDSYIVTVNDRAFYIGAEVSGGKINRVIEAESVSAVDHQPVSEEEKESVIRAMCTYFDRNRTTYTVYLRYDSDEVM